MRVRSSVEAIDRVRKVVRVKDLATGREYDEPYDKLILSPGAAPIRPAIPGADLPGVMTLRNLQDVDRIKAVVDGGARRAVVVGAGFIGLELVENLVHRGVETTLVESQAQVLPLLDREMVAPLADALQAAGVREIPSATVVAIEARGNSFAVRLGSGEPGSGQELECDLVVLGVGVRPENRLAVDAGLAIAPRGGIVVDKYLTTNDPDIFAVGDAVAAPDFFSGEPVQVPLAGPANRQGRIAADNAFGRRVPYRGTQGTAILGCSARRWPSRGPPRKCSAGRHPVPQGVCPPGAPRGVLPGAEGMTLKLLFAPDDDACWEHRGSVARGSTNGSTCWRSPCKPG